MGTIQHHAIIVTDSDYGDHHSLAEAHEIAKGIFPWVSEISPVATNGYQSFFIPPDGSKEWWDESDAGNERREAFKAKLNEIKWGADWLEVSWGELGYTVSSRRGEISVRTDNLQ